MSNHHQQPEDLAWEAFRYAAGEMNAAEMARFEERLASEQPAREALAAAVELAQATSLAMVDAKVTRAPAPASPQKRSWSWKWGAVAAAVCIVAYTALTALEFGDWKSSSDTAANQQELAARWSEVRELESAVDEDSSAETGAEFGFELGAADDSNDTEAEDATAPDWMLAAVEGLRSQKEMMDDEKRVDPPQEH